MTVRANAIDLGFALALAVWQIASLPFAHHAWVSGDRVSGTADYLLPTTQLVLALMGAARARGRRAAWGRLAVAGRTSGSATCSCTASFPPPCRPH